MSPMDSLENPLAVASMIASAVGDLPHYLPALRQLVTRNPDDVDPVLPLLKKGGRAPAA